MQSQQFAELSRQSYNRIPVSRRVLADCETPLSAYAKLANRPYTFLFESVEGGEKWGRYSIIGLAAKRWMRVVGDCVETYLDGQLQSQHQSEDPLADVEQYQQQFRVPDLPELPPFHGGLVGYFGYDTVRYVEPRLKNSAASDQLGHADILLMVCDECLVFDNLSGVVTLICHADPAQDQALELAHQRLDELSSALRAPAPALPELDLNPESMDEAEFRSSFGEQAFKDAVETVREYILAGDAMQVVLSQRMSVPFTAAPLSFYRALRHLNPSPYLYYLDLGEVQVAGSSPEILARLEGGEIKVRPIAGTRRRGHDEAEDAALEADLLADPKELAEHLMLIDLGRNDVGRVANIGSVDVTDTMVVERYSHVMHIVSNVSAQARDDVSAMDVLRATLPAGTLSGAPKVRAMEIIDELEPVKRGIYGGAIGYLGWQGNMDTAIAIRTAVISDGQLHIQAGAGVVADSQPRLEWKETMNKARALFRAVAMSRSSDKGGRYMLLMIDNYDSFTFNVVQYLGELGADVLVRRNDEISIVDIEALKPEKIVISPGPCTPNEAGISMACIKHFAGSIPLLGICLGHQSMGQVFGGEVVRARQVMHGKTSPIHHRNEGVFSGLEQPLIATRYHSLVVDWASLPDCLEVTAWTCNEAGEPDEIMGLRHKTLDVEGVQFHPESILTRQGHELLNNFLTR